MFGIAACSLSAALRRMRVLHAEKETRSCTAEECCLVFAVSMFLHALKEPNWQSEFHDYMHWLKGFLQVQYRDAGYGFARHGDIARICHLQTQQVVVPSHITNPVRIMLPFCF